MKADSQPSWTVRHTQCWSPVRPDNFSTPSAALMSTWACKRLRLALENNGVCACRAHNYVSAKTDRAAHAMCQQSRSVASVFRSYTPTFAAEDIKFYCRQGCLCGPHQCSADTGGDTWQKQAKFIPHAWLANTHRTSAVTLPCQSAQKHSKF